MQLPQFIQRALTFFDKAEANLTATQELDAARAKATELEGKLAEALGIVAERDKTIVSLQAAQEPLNVQIKVLTGELEAERAKVTETLAGLGVKPDGIPADGKAQEAAKPGKTLLDEMNAISDPRQRTEFYRKNRDKILAAWRPSAPPKE